MSLVVADTTPLNYLILIDQIYILHHLFGKLLVPPAVISELRHQKAPQLVSDWSENLPPWVEIRAPHENLNLPFGHGENEAIALALELTNAALLIDDKKAKNEAASRGLLTIGTITILDLADESGLLDFEEALSDLLATNFHIEDALLVPVRAKVLARKNP